MNAFVRLGIIGLGVLGLPGVAGAQSEATADVTVEVAQAVAITISTQLDFGHLKGDDGGEEDGTVTVTPSGERFATGGAKLLGGTNRPRFAPAEFTIGGEPNALYNIVLPVPQTATPDLGVPVLLVTALESSPSGTDTIGPDGTATVLVGGTLEVPAQTHPDVFRADIELIVNYE